MVPDGHVAIPATWQTVPKLRQQLEQSSRVMMVEETSRKFKLPPGHSAKFVPANGDGSPCIEVYFDHGPREQHQLIRVLLMPETSDVDALNILTRLHGEPLDAFPTTNGHQADADEEDDEAGAPARVEPPTPISRRSVPMKPTRPVPQIMLGPKVALAYEFLARHYRVRGQGEVVADDRNRVLTKEYGHGLASYYFTRLRTAKLIVARDGHTYLVEAEVAAGNKSRWNRRPDSDPTPTAAIGSRRSHPQSGTGGGGRKSKAVPPTAPSLHHPRITRAQAPQPSTNGHVDHAEVLEFFTDHADVIRSVGLLGRGERIGSIVMQAEELLAGLEPGLVLVDGQEGFALRLKSQAAARRPPGRRQKLTRKKK